MILTYYFIVLAITAILFLINKSKNGATVENSFNFHNFLFTGFVNCFWPVLIVLFVIDKVLGSYLPKSNYGDVIRADSLRSIPNTPSQSNNTGKNISNSPDQL